MCGFFPSHKSTNKTKLKAIKKHSLTYKLSACSSADVCKKGELIKGINMTSLDCYFLLRKWVEMGKKKFTYLYLKPSSFFGRRYKHTICGKSRLKLTIAQMFVYSSYCTYNTKLLNNLLTIDSISNFSL